MMNKDNNQEVSGYIEQDGRYAVFTGNKFHFTFIPEKDANKLLDEIEKEEATVAGKLDEYYKKQSNVGISGLYFGIQPDMILKAENGFIKGTTYNGEDILIYTGGDMALAPIRYLNTWLYIVGHSTRIDECNAIKFNSGILKSLFYAGSLKLNHDQEYMHSNVPVDDSDDGIDTIKSEPILRQSFECYDDSITVRFDDDEKNSSDGMLNDEVPSLANYRPALSRLSVYSPVSRSISIREGTKIVNDGVELVISFKNSEQTVNVFRNCYYDILTLCQFMSYRQNVAFDHVSLMQKGHINGEEHLIDIADCYIKQEKEIEPYRDINRCITFNDLGSSTASLFSFICSREKKDSQYVIDFIPKSNFDARIMTVRKLRDVCISLECEVRLNNIKLKNGGPFYDLVKNIRNMVKNSKNESVHPTDREYSFITGNIKHWDGPAAELDKILFDKYKGDVDYIMKVAGISDLSEDDIQQVVKARNLLAHGGGIVLDDNTLVNTTLILMGVVYASILSRSGCSSEQIRGWIAGGLLTVA